MPPSPHRLLFACALLGGLLNLSTSVWAQSSPAPTTDAEPAPAPQTWSLHAQATTSTQYHAALHSPYSADNSLLPTESKKESFDATLFLGVRAWPGGELYINPEINQGYGMSNSVGIAGFPSAEAYKVGGWQPKLRVQRLFARHVIALDGGSTAVESAANTLAGTQAVNNVTITAGKFSSADIFDNNSYAHDARSDFLNWALVDAGAFDYPADAWGYTQGLTVEWNQNDWTTRTGILALSTIPNGKTLDRTFEQHSWLIELERRYQLAEHSGKVRVLAFWNTGHVARYSDALALAAQTTSPPDLQLVRKTGTKFGWVVNLEQELSSNVGAFWRYSKNNWNLEAVEYTDIGRSTQVGARLKGELWQAPEHELGVAWVQNEISPQARAYLAAGGQALMIGDGRLRYGSEKIAELYYAVALGKHFTLTGDYQRVLNPAYNADRGPVNVLGFRLHAEY